MTTDYMQGTLDLPGCATSTRESAQPNRVPIKPLAKPAYPIRCPGVDIHENLLTLSIGPGHTGEKPHRGGKRRGITRWTAASRLRWMWLLAQVQWSGMPQPLWITLTYHGADGYWPADPYRHLHQWLHVIQSNHGPMHYVWRLQWQARGAPHFHIILWPPNLTNLHHNVSYRQSLAYSWHEIADPSSKPHLTYGAKIELLESYRHATRYIARYVAKESQDDIVSTGTRRWGHSRNLPRSPVLSIELSVREALLVRRIVRRLVRSQARNRSKADRYVMGHSQIRIFASAHTIIQILDYVLALEENRSGAYVPMR